MPDFSIQKIGRFRKALISMLVMLSLLRSFKNDPNSAYTVFLLHRLNISNPYDQFLEWEEYYRHANPISRIIFVLISLLLSPGLLVLLLFLLTKGLITMWRESSEFDSVAGFYAAIPELKNTIFTNSSYTNNEQELTQEHIVTHEHIHLLQYHVNTIDDDYTASSKRLRNVKAILSKNRPIAKHVIYLLQRNEVEARLHEVVLSFFRIYKVLPINIQEFLRLLYLNNEIGPFLMANLEETCTESISEKFITRYDTRSRLIGEDLSMLLYSMSDDRLMAKYAIEVLAPMYANLLRYYGDEKAATTFGQDIQRPNLYDQLYLNIT